MAFAASGMDLETYHIKEVRQRKANMISLKSGINSTNELTKQKQTHRHRKQTYTYQRGRQREG